MKQNVELHCDSQNAFHLARNLVFHSHIKHIDVHFHFVYNVVGDDQVTLLKIHTDMNPAYMLTQPMT